MGGVGVVGWKFVSGVVGRCRGYKDTSGVVVGEGGWDW